MTGLKPTIYSTLNKLGLLSDIRFGVGTQNHIQFTQIHITAPRAIAGTYGVYIYISSKLMLFETVCLDYLRIYGVRSATRMSINASNRRLCRAFGVVAVVARCVFKVAWLKVFVRFRVVYICIYSERDPKYNTQTNTHVCLYSARTHIHHTLNVIQRTTHHM